MSISDKHQDNTPDTVVIVGGGIIGMSVAYYLLLRSNDAPKHVIVCEQNTIGSGATMAAAAMVACDWDAGMEKYEALAKTSFELHEALMMRIDSENHEHFKPVDVYQLEMSEVHDTDTDIHVPLTYVNTRNVRSCRAVGTHNKNRMCDVSRVMTYLYDKCKEMGGVIRENCRVESLVLEPSSDKVTHVCVSVEDRREMIAADACVLALGSWSNNAKAWLPNHVKLPRILPEPAYSVHLKPPSSDVKGRMSDMLFVDYRWENNDDEFQQCSYSNVEMYPRADGTVVISGGLDDDRLTSAGPPPVLHDNLDTKNVDLSVANYIHELGTRVVPSLHAYNVSNGFIGYMPYTTDGAPVIDTATGVSGVYVCTGHACWGILLSQASAKAVSELVMDGRVTCVDIAKFSISRLATN